TRPLAAIAYVEPATTPRIVKARSSLTACSARRCGAAGLTRTLLGLGGSELRLGGREALRGVVWRRSLLRHGPCVSSSCRGGLSPPRPKCPTSSAGWDSPSLELQERVGAEGRRRVAVREVVTHRLGQLLRGPGAARR